MENTQTEPKNSIGELSKSMLIVMILTMVGKVAGFGREMVFASQFGATAIKSAYTTANNLPAMVLSVIVTALSATLIPAYSGQLQHGREKANRFVNNLFTIGMIFSVIVLIATAAFLEPLTNFIMRGTEDMETRRLAVQLAQLMMPMGIFVFLTRITSAYLQANFNFTIPAISQLVLNLVIIGAIFLSRGVNITYVAIGTVLGWALQFLVQVPAVRRTGYRYRPVFDLKESGLRDVLVLMIPVLISSIFDQAYFTIDTMVAYNGDVSDPGKLDYANRLSTMVSAVLLTTIATVLYPSLVRSTDRKARFTEHFSFGINLNLLIAVPALVALIVLRVPVTKLVYQYGKFTAEDALQTAPLLAGYSAGILGVGIRELCNRSFYAYKDTVVPTVTGIGVVLLNVALNYILHPIMGPVGITVATAISVALSSAVLLVLLHRKYGVVDWRRILRCFVKVAVATALMAVVFVVMDRLFGFADQGRMRMFLLLIVAFVAGVGVYLGALILLRTEELGMLRGLIRSKLRRGR